MDQGARLRHASLIAAAVLAAVMGVTGCSWSAYPKVAPPDLFL